MMALSVRSEPSHSNVGRFLTTRQELPQPRTLLAVLGRLLFRFSAHVPQLLIRPFVLWIRLHRLSVKINRPLVIASITVGPRQAPSMTPVAMGTPSASALSY